MFFQGLKKKKLQKNSLVQLTPGKLLKFYKQGIDEVHWVDLMYSVRQNCNQIV